MLLTLALFMTGCQKSKAFLFVEKYKLQNYDTIYVVSCISCGGCIVDFAALNCDHSDSNTIFVFDGQCKDGKHIKELKKYKHMSINQIELESYFGEFGNMIIIYNNKEGISYKKYPE